MATQENFLPTCAPLWSQESQGREFQLWCRGCKLASSMVGSLWRLSFVWREVLSVKEWIFMIRTAFYKMPSDNVM